MKDIVIIGTSGFAKEMRVLIADVNKKYDYWNFKGYVTENKDRIDESFGDSKIIMSDDQLSYENIIIAIGDCQTKELIVNKLNGRSVVYPIFIHPNAIGDWNKIKLEEGNIICSGCNFTTDIKIGRHNIFNLDCTIGHDIEIGNFNNLNPSVNISGNVKIENNVYISTGAQIIQGINICSNVIIGAGAVVVEDIMESGTYIGVPARLKNNG